MTSGYESKRICAALALALELPKSVLRHVPMLEPMPSVAGCLIMNALFRNQ
jgi:hypothetical protein